ncbi:MULTISPECIES: hypothetical protein [Streptomyces]|uniref:hypothetical protein n=1 Tax=Streptomyces TaxID=1883 RepID=UPI000997A8B1|nr:MULTISPECIES: hypothetical protein [Streptomyces]
MSEPIEGARPGPKPEPGVAAAEAAAAESMAEPTAGPSSEPPSGPPSEAPSGPSSELSAESARPADPAPLGVTRTPTGVAEIDAQLDRLADADHLAASGHLEVYEDVHRGLRDALTALDRRPGPPAPAPPAPVS